MEVYKSIQCVMADMSKLGVGKTQKNTQQGYMYRGINDIMDAIAPLLPKHDLVIIPEVTKVERQERQTKNGGSLFYTYVEMQYTIVSTKDESKVVAKFPAEGMDVSDKATNKAIAFAYKYMITQTFCIPYEGQVDGDSETPDAGRNQPQQTQEQPRQQAQAPVQQKPAAPATPAAGSDEEKKQFGSWIAGVVKSAGMLAEKVEIGQAIEPYEDYLDVHIKPRMKQANIPNRLWPSAERYVKFIWWQLVIAASGPNPAEQDKVIRGVTDDGMLSPEAKAKLTKLAEEAKKIPW